MTSLNPALYEALEREFGKVYITHPGAELQANYVKGLNGRTQMQVISPGEYLKINCPFCCDHGHRLWINHRWGVPDKKTGTRNWWLAICYNEDCLSDEDNRVELIRRTSGYHRRAGAGRVHVCPGVVEDVGKPIALPSDFIPLDQLKDGHRACRYLRERGFDPDEIFDRWAVGYSKSRAFRSSSPGRLVIPVFRLVDGQPVQCGWQARRIAEVESEPKYFTAPGLKKSRLLYGIEQVDQSTTPVLIVEGPTDVWRAGKNAVALLGHYASTEQVQLMRRHFAKRPLVIALDTDAAEEAQELASTIRQARSQSLLRPDDSPVVVVELSGDRDPADYKRSELWKLVRRTVCRGS